MDIPRREKQLEKGYTEFFKWNFPANHDMCVQCG